MHGRGVLKGLLFAAISFCRSGLLVARERDQALDLIACGAPCAWRYECRCRAARQRAQVTELAVGWWDGWAHRGLLLSGSGTTRPEQAGEAGQARRHPGAGVRARKALDAPGKAGLLALGVGRDADGEVNQLVHLL